MKLSDYNGVESYFKDLNGKKTILLDFDSTCVVEEWPFVGELLPGCIKVLTKLQEEGHKLIFCTQRNLKYPFTHPRLNEFSKEYPYYKDEDENGHPYIDILTICKQLLYDNGIKFWDINRNYHWEWCTSDIGRKIFSDYIIDDHCVGMKYIIRENRYGEKVKCCDWKFIDQWLVNEGLYKECVL